MTSQGVGPNHDPTSISNAATQGDNELSSEDAPRLPDVYKDYHESCDVDSAVAQMLEPYVGLNNNEPTMDTLVLATNVGRDPLHSNAVSGYAATVHGEAPAGSLITNAIGTGTTWFSVTGANGARIEDKDVETTFEACKYDVPNLRVSLVSGIQYPSRVHYVVVHGNDPQSAKVLVDAAHKSTASVEDVISGRLSKMYEDTIKRSYDVRTKAAMDFINAHKLDLSSSQPGNACSNFVTNSRKLSTNATSSRVKGRNVYIVHNNVVDPSACHSGFMMYRGPIAGYLYVTGKSKTVKGANSVAWINSTPKGHPFSMFPADTGRYLGTDSGRTPDRHRDTDENVKAAHAKRVRWSGPVASFNPYSNEIYHGKDDAHNIISYTKLGAPPGGNVHFHVLDAIVTHVPGLRTKECNLEELNDILSKCNEAALPLNTGTFLKLVASWSRVDEQNLSNIFAEQRGDVIMASTSILREIDQERREIVREETKKDPL